MQTETLLTVQAAKDYAASKGLRVLSAAMSDEDGTPVVFVAIREPNGTVGRMEVWAECGRLYGEW